MKKAILIAMVIWSLLVPVVGQAFTIAENCSDAIRFDWCCDTCNTACLFALMADVLGPGPDGVW